jgi:UDP-N-acetyl-D-mannosaminuronic acid transferase (WecB/TagA/CpsF family)
MSPSESPETVLERPGSTIDAAPVAARIPVTTSRPAVRTPSRPIARTPSRPVARAPVPEQRVLPSVPPHATVPLLGLDFADLDAGRAAALLASRPTEAPFGYVVTPNADHLVRVVRDPALTAIYRNAFLRLLDSRVVAGAAAALRLPVPRVAPGSDVTALLLAQFLRRGERITIVGLRAAWLPALVERCGLAPPAHYEPPMGFAADPAALAATVAFVLAHPARFVFLAVGSPQQEVLAAAIAATGRATGTALCIGASLEFLTGVSRRAPAWMQRAGLEWLFRLGSEPHRLARRYLLNSPAVFRLLLAARFGRLL